MVKTAARALNRKTQAAFELKGGVNGLKMIIGVTLIVFAGQIPVLKAVCTEYPSLCGYTGPILGYLDTGLEWLKLIFENAGKVMIWVGALGKFLKFFRG